MTAWTRLPHGPSAVASGDGRPRIPALAPADGRRAAAVLRAPNIRPPLRLVLFDDHNIIAALVHHRLRDVALGQERSHRAHPPFQDPWLSEGLDSRDHIGVVVHDGLGQGHASLVRQRRYEAGPWHTLFCGTA